MFSWFYIGKATNTFLRYPSAIPKLLGGSTKAIDHMDILRKKKWLKNKITNKHLYDFSIELNANDITGVVPGIAVDGLYELGQTEVLRKILKKNMVFIDVGANIGWYTLLSSRIIGNQGVVVSFEPEPNNFALLMKSKEANGFQT